MPRDNSQNESVRPLINEEDDFVINMLHFPLAPSEVELTLKDQNVGQDNDNGHHPSHDHPKDQEHQPKLPERGLNVHTYKGPDLMGVQDVREYQSDRPQLAEQDERTIVLTFKDEADLNKLIQNKENWSKFLKTLSGISLGATLAAGLGTGIAVPYAHGKAEETDGLDQSNVTGTIVTGVLGGAITLVLGIAGRALNEMKKATDREIENLHTQLQHTLSQRTNAEQNKKDRSAVDTLMEVSPQQAMVLKRKLELQRKRDVINLDCRILRRQLTIRPEERDSIVARLNHLDNELSSVQRELVELADLDILVSTHDNKDEFYNPELWQHEGYTIVVSPDTGENNEFQVKYYLGVDSAQVEAHDLDVDKSKRNEHFQNPPPSVAVQQNPDLNAFLDPLNHSRRGSGVSTASNPDLESTISQGSETQLRAGAVEPSILPRRSPRPRPR